MLTELQCKQAKPRDKIHNLSDGRGLLLSVYSNGAKYWILRYFINGKEKRTSLGSFPALSLKEARDKAFEFKKNLSEPKIPKSPAFSETADEWLKTRILPDKAKTYIEVIEMRLKNHILPVIGDMRLSEITPSVVLGMCRKIEALGIIETAFRCKQIVGQVFKYAIATDKAETEPTSALSGALKARKHKHFAALTDRAKIAALMRQIKEYPFTVVRCALMFSALTFCRPGEVRHAEWAEIDFDGKIWAIPAEKMKMKRAHIVPMSTQLVTVCHDLATLTGNQKWLFPSTRKDGRPMSENTISMALRAMGFGRDDMTAHGFRGMASTILNEAQRPDESRMWSGEAIEMQLAHAERNQIRAAYNHAEYLPERRKMMQWYADWLDSLK